MSLIILGRDGVINYSSADYIKSADEWEPIPGSLEAIACLNQEGYRVVVASNQPGIAQKRLSIDDLNAIHRKMINSLAWHGGKIEAVCFCPHEPKDDCDCRKPKPGLLLEMSRRFNQSLSKIFMVGDSLYDLKASQAAGTKPLLVRTGNGKALEESGKVPADVDICDNLYSAVELLLNESITH